MRIDRKLSTKIPQGIITIYYFNGEVNLLFKNKCALELGSFVSIKLLNRIFYELQIHEISLWEFEQLRDHVPKIKILNHGI